MHSTGPTLLPSAPRPVPSGRFRDHAHPCAPAFFPNQTPHCRHHRRRGPSLALESTLTHCCTMLGLPISPYPTMHPDSMVCSSPPPPCRACSRIGTRMVATILLNNHGESKLPSSISYRLLLVFLLLQCCFHVLSPNCSIKCHLQSPCARK
ncbi:hypothetical protein CDL15_Pgr005108 [Punica granatum]|uniref:Uncharacterized protein n=1 Tax=Punica granatum TaxID=22663 RepID=A0A218WPX7_PUNGR|nr:hypothetical protein CDL15_Pgr005108 [Punica granatum]